MRCYTRTTVFEKSGEHYLLLLSCSMIFAINSVYYGYNEHQLAWGRGTRSKTMSRFAAATPIPISISMVTLNLSIERNIEHMYSLSSMCTSLMGVVGAIRSCGSFSLSLSLEAWILYIVYWWDCADEMKIANDLELTYMESWSSMS